MARLRIPPFLLPFAVFSLVLIVPTFIWLSYNGPEVPRNDEHTSISLAKAYQIGDEVEGGVIMPALGNATAKAELGRATWKLLHTMAQRYPDTPTADEKSAFRSYFYLFSRLYPCGDCSRHFQKLLKEYPPQTSSRKAASMWLCGIHNRVNERLGKEEFDCSNLDGLYDCGCGEEGKDTPVSEGKPETDRVDSVTGEELIPGRRG